MSDGIFAVLMMFHRHFKRRFLMRVLWHAIRSDHGPAAIRQYVTEAADLYDEIRRGDFG